MATVEQTLSELQPGQRVALTLKDGTEISGTFRGRDTDRVQLADGDQDQVEAGLIERVLLEFKTQGPE